MSPDDEVPEEDDPERKAPGESFERVLERARSGEPEAWNDIFSRLGDEAGEGAEILAIARRALPKTHWARHLVESRDIVQSALRVGWLHADQFQGRTEGEFFAWLRTILRNKVHRATRRRDARAVSLSPDPDGEVEAPLPAPESPDPIVPMIEAEVHQRVREAVAELPEDQRVVMELYLQGMSAPEIARTLDLKPATVRKRESRAVERLRELIH